MRQGPRMIKDKERMAIRNEPTALLHKTQHPRKGPYTAI